MVNVSLCLSLELPTVLRDKAALLTISQTCVVSAVIPAFALHIFINHALLAAKNNLTYINSSMLLILGQERKKCLIVRNCKYQHDKDIIFCYNSQLPVLLRPSSICFMQK